MQQIFVLFNEVISLITPLNLVVISGSTILGILIGALPGLTSTMGIALLTGITYGLNPTVALLILMGVYVGGTYGGSIAAVLIGIPGTGSAAATILDGHQLARQGKGRMALSLATISSFIGTIFGMILLAVFTPMLQNLALNFTSAEYTLLAIFGVTICGSLTAAGEPIKGWIGGMLGLALSCVGLDQIYGYQRFVFGIPGLMNGIAMVPAMIGLFGIPSVVFGLASMEKKAEITKIDHKDRKCP